MFVIFCDVITFVYSCRAAAIETQAAHQPLVLSLHSAMRYSPSEGFLTLGRTAQTDKDKRPKPSDESEQTSSFSHTLNSIKCSPILRPHMRAAVEHHQATTAVHEFTLGIHARILVLAPFPRAAVDHYRCSLGLLSAITDSRACRSLSVIFLHHLFGWYLMDFHGIPNVRRISLASRRKL